MKKWNEKNTLFEGYNGMVLFQDALAQLRGMSSGVSRVGESYETLQSRARELEKKVCVLIIIYYISFILSPFFFFQI